MNLLARPFPKPPAQVEIYVETHGTDMTIEFLLKFRCAAILIAIGREDS